MAFSTVCNTSSAHLLENDELQVCYGESDGGVSSGYDSGSIYDSDADSQTGNETIKYSRNSKPEPDVAHFYNNPLLLSDSDTDSDCLSEYSEESDSEDSDDSEDEIDDGERFTSTNNLCDSLKYILSLPELCDVTFLVGSNKIPIHGVKAILGTRSRVLYAMILKAEKAQSSKQIKSKKQKTPERLTIHIDTYEAEVFRKIIQFVHSGTVNVDSSSVIGLLCGAEEFGLTDLKMACWDYVERCVASGNDLHHLMTSPSHMYNQNIANVVLKKVAAKVDFQSTGLDKTVSFSRLLKKPRETIV
ncbi:serine-enriched protein-like [Argopecten irradians]|uniref:serine-enriched protein-like n=1 Tax=Argopecten irradians TaxID=31199 RepID=UPI00371A1B31